MSEAFEEVTADNNPLSPIDWRAVSVDLRRALENRNAEIDRLRAELAALRSEHDCVVQGCQRYEKRATAAANRDAQEITRLEEALSAEAGWGEDRKQIARLTKAAEDRDADVQRSYEAGKRDGLAMGALAMEADEIARLREALETVRPHIATLDWNSEGEYGWLVAQIDAALATPPEGKGE